VQLFDQSAACGHHRYHKDPSSHLGSFCSAACRRICPVSDQNQIQSRLSCVSLCLCEEKGFGLGDRWSMKTTTTDAESNEWATHASSQPPSDASKLQTSSRRMILGSQSAFTQRISPGFPTGERSFGLSHSFGADDIRTRLDAVRDGMTLDGTMARRAWAITHHLAGFPGIRIDCCASQQICLSEAQRTHAVRRGRG
jgi:hypothetical protein